MADEAKAPTAAQTPKPAPSGLLFTITANSHRELALKVAQALLKTDAFDMRQTSGGKDGKGVKADYALWNLDDSGTIANYNDGITLTAEEAKMFPTSKGVPVVFSSSFALRQLTPPSVVAAKITERRLATATREANRAAGASTSTLLDELNRRRAAAGLAPVKEDE